MIMWRWHEPIIGMPFLGPPDALAPLAGLTWNVVAALQAAISHDGISDRLAFRSYASTRSDMRTLHSVFTGSLSPSGVTYPLVTGSSHAPQSWVRECIAARFYPFAEYTASTASFITIRLPSPDPNSA